MSKLIREYNQLEIMSNELAEALQSACKELESWLNAAADEGMLQRSAQEPERMRISKWRTMATTYLENSIAASERIVSAEASAEMQANIAEPEPCPPITREAVLETAARAVVQEWLDDGDLSDAMDDPQCDIERLMANLRDALKEKP